MPRPPNDSKRRRSARAPKRKGQASVPHRANVVAFPIADAPQAEAGANLLLPEIQQVLDATISLTPLQLLAVIIKAKLGDRIEEQEVRRICQVYYAGLSLIWGDEEE